MIYLAVIYTYLFIYIYVYLAMSLIIFTRISKRVEITNLSLNMEPRSFSTFHLYISNIRNSY